jgi:hypothetical protein
MYKKILRHCFSLFFMIVFSVGFYFLAGYIRSIIPNYIFPSNNLLPEVWSDGFLYWFLIILGAILFLNILWYVFEQWVLFKPLSARIRWYLLLIIVLILTINISVYFLHKYPVEEKQWIPYLIYIIVGFFSFYLPTLFFAPSSVKYSAPLSSVVRRYW